MLKFVKYQVDPSTLTSLYKSLIRPLMEHGDVIWNNCYDWKLDSVHGHAQEREPKEYCVGE